MQYYSLNHQSSKASFKEAMTISEAADGGLYMPERLPVLPKALFNNMSLMSLKDIAFVVNSTLFGEDMPASTIKRIGDDAASYMMPLYEIEQNIYVLELFHGPTKTVKDFGALTLTRLLHELHSSSDTDLNVLVATHGNSGSAIAHAFHNMPGVNIIVLYPRGTAKHQIEPIMSMGDNIHVIEVEGSVDDCKDMVAKAFADRDLDMTLTSANSLNLGSLLPSTIPYFHAYGQLQKKQRKIGEIYMSIPTGNCGNILAGYIAKKMGLPVTKLIAACNENGFFYRYINNGDRRFRRSNQHTYAPSIENNHPVNIPRFDELCGGDLDVLRKDIIAEVGTDYDIVRTVNDVFERTGYLLDPHSAIAYYALKKNLPKGASGIVMATSHPSKSVEILQRINEGGLKLPFSMKKRNFCPRPEAKIPATYGALRKYLKYYCEEQRQSRFA